LENAEKTMRLTRESLTKVLTALAAALCFTLSSVHAVEVSAGNSFAITTVRVFDGEQVLPQVTVIVRDGLIDALGEDTAVPDGLQVIDGGGKTLLPGLIDSHVHVFPGAQEDAVRFGVTTVLDMYNFGGRQAADTFRAQRGSPGRTAAADTWTSLAGATPPGGHPSQMAAEWGLEIPTLAPGGDAGEFVRDRIADGSDFIKIMQDETQLGETRLVKFDAQQLHELIGAVHDAGLLAVVHVSARNEAHAAFAGDADLIAHMFQDQVADDELVQLARTRDGAVIGTLSVLASASGTDHAQRLMAHPDAKDLLSEAQQQTLAAGFGGERPEILQRALESVRKFHAAGVPVLAGTDAPNPGTAHGISIHQELELLVEAGMSAAEALRAATAVPAERFGLGDRGKIVPGLRADLLLVRGDPTRDILHTRQIEKIWKNGYQIDRSLQEGSNPPPD
jgi:imidazolonepropionase-like amidohydrolase